LEDRNQIHYDLLNTLQKRIDIIKIMKLFYWNILREPYSTSNKKNPIPNEYYISNQIISRMRLSKYFFVEATFHHPMAYSQLLIIIFKDIVTSEHYPGLKYYMIWCLHQLKISYLKIIYMS